MKHDISVIVPVHNAQETLKRAIDSLLVQTIPLNEIILVENGSSDSSWEICMRMSDANENVKAVINPTVGVSTSRNCGIEISRGEYIGFVDADDYAAPRMYELLSDSMPGTDFSICEYMVERGSISGNVDVLHVQSLPAESTEQLKNLKESPEAIIDAMLGRIDSSEMPFMSSVWRGLYKADIIKGNSIRFPDNLEIGEDVIFNLTYLNYVKKCSFCHEALYHYTQSALSVSNRLSESMWDKYKKYLDAVLEFAAKNSYSTERVARVHDKIHGMSGWIASMYSSSDYPLNERIGLLRQIASDRQNMLKNDLSRLEYNWIDKALDRGWTKAMLMRGEMVKLKHLLMRR